MKNILLFLVMFITLWAGQYDKVKITPDISYIYDTPQFKNVILAAPDIDSEVFQSNLYPKIIKTTEKITIYTSSKDTALQVSHSVHDRKRLGEGGENISVFKNIVTIDASGLDTSFIGLGHSYFSEKKILVNI